MTDLYREFAVAVDPEFARELKAQLDARRVRQHGPPKPLPAEDYVIQLPSEVTLVPTPDQHPDHRGRRVGLLAAAVVAVLVAGAVLVLATSDDDAGLRPADTPPTDSTAPATVEPPSAPADRQFAGAVALRPNDWGPNYTFGRWSPRFRMSRELAETMPECEPFLGTVFESPSRPATVTTATASTGTTAAAAHWQYLVVFADVAGAEAMMDALHDPRYPKCDERYRSEYSGMRVADNFGIGGPPQLDLAGDESVVVGVIESSLRGGHQTIPFVRAGRTVMTFDSRYDDDELVTIVARAVERIEAAEAGAPLASASLPLEYLTKAAVTQWHERLSDAGWTSAPLPGLKLDRSVGLAVPSCAAFVDVFLSSQIGPGWGEDHDESKSLAYDAVSYAIDPQAPAAGVFRVMAIGYARQQDAQDAMDAISDPGFSRCLTDYASAEPPNEMWQAATREPISVSALSSLGDENVQMLFEGSYTGLDGTTSSAGRIVEMFVRVDQVLIGVQVTLDHMSTDEFESGLQRMVDGAEAAIAGAPIPPGP